MGCPVNPAVYLYRRSGKPTRVCLIELHRPEGDLPGQVRHRLKLILCGL